MEDFFLKLLIQQSSKSTLGCPEKYINKLLEVKTMLKRGNVIMKFCKMEDQVANIFTLGLSKEQLVKNMYVLTVT